MSGFPKVETVVIGGVLGAGLLIAMWVLKRGGIQNAAEVLTTGAIRAADGAAAGVVGGVGSVVGLPTPSQTVTSPAQARYLIDVGGFFFASRWASAGALAQGALMTAWSGTPPPVGSPAHAALLQLQPQATTGDFARIDRADYYETSGRNGSNGQPDLSGGYDALGNWTGMP